MGIQLPFRAFVDLSMKTLQITDLKCTIGLLFHNVSFSSFHLRNPRHNQTPMQSTAKEEVKLSEQMELFM